MILLTGATAAQPITRKDAASMQDNKPGVAVIGGGLAGLSAATTLNEAGSAVTLFDCEPAPGGRLGQDTRADLGAQYFTVRHPAFRQACRDWEARGWIVEWSPQLYQQDLEHGLRSSADDIQRLVAVPGMASLAGYLQQGLEIRQADISQLQRTAQGEWLLRDADGNEYGPFRALILATPAEQASALLCVAPSLQQDVARVRMRPCWSVLLEFAQPLPTLVDACFVRDGPLDWLARNNSKPQRSGNESWVLQSTASWAEQHVQLPAAAVVAELALAMERVTGQRLPEPLDSQAHYWPQARPAEQLKWGALAAPRLSLYVCGDWCLGGRIENAWLSGRQAARALLDS